MPENPARVPVASSLSHRQPATSLKHALNPSFALLFAVGVERLYAVFDPVVLRKTPGAPIMVPNFYLPLTMVLLTLLFGTLSSVTNDRFVEANPHAPATSAIAWLSYASIFIALVMFYFSVDLSLVKYWWLGYATLCLVNAAWNRRAVQYPDHRHHVGVNIIVALIILTVLLLSSSAVSTPRGFSLLLLVILPLKLWHRRKKRTFITV